MKPLVMNRRPAMAPEKRERLAAQMKERWQAKLAGADANGAAKKDPRATPRLWQQLTAREQKWAQKDLGAQVDRTAAFSVRHGRWEQAPIAGPDTPAAPRFAQPPLEVATEWAQQFVHGAETPLEKTMRLALAAAGTDEAGFRRLPKKEQADFLAQATGDQRPEAIAAAAKAGEGFRQIARELIERSPTNRTEFDEGKLVETTESIKVHGILQPLLVRPIKYEVRPWGGGDRFVLVRLCGDSVTELPRINLPADIVEAELKHAYASRPHFEIVAGERRWICAGRAGLAEVPCMVRNLNNRDALKAQLVENLQREDLRDLDEARGYQRMKEEGFTMDEIAEAVGKKRATIYAKLALLELPPETRAALEQGDLKASQAEIISSIGDRAAQEKFTHELLAEKDDVSFRETKARAAEIKEELAAEKKWQEETAPYQAKGYKVLTRAQSAGLFNYGSLRAGYVLASAVCEYDGKGRTWKALLGEHAPGVIVAHQAYSYSGPPGPRLLHTRAAATKALALAGHEDLAQASTKESREAKQKREREEQNEAQQAALAISRAKVGQIAAAAEARELTADVLRLIVRRFEDKARQVVERRNLPVDEKKPEHERYQKALEVFCAKADGKRLRGVVMELLCYGQWGYFDEGMVNAAGKVYGVKFQAPGKKK
ncbi:MAG TPA: ParB/RepB/Spo0J family partition protein [Chthoniobacteraceae bacterium]|jgi:ParB/RepB/Spo0J family partition protein|nr:ParB/RepB/Spo0J family partition protein [Chthoniobacteraceae bacterium]